MRRTVLVVSFLIALLLLLPGSFFLLREAMLKAGFSWMLAEWIPYSLLIASGCGLAIAIVGMLSSMKRSVRYAVATVLCIAPFAIGFAMHPIYEDALWDGSVDMQQYSASDEYAGADLVVIAIPDCPYCKRATMDLQALHLREPHLRLRMTVITRDSTWLAPYIELSNGAFEVVQAHDMNSMATHAGGHFPAYVLVKDNKPVCRWSNNEWGPVAKDIVEGTRE